jgi:subtilisin family serine protease
MISRRLILGATALAFVVALDVRPARSGPLPPVGTVRHVTSPSIGANYLRALGPRAVETLAPNSGLVGALVALPQGARAEDLGLDPVAPGIGRLRASAARVDAFASAHPELHLEIAPPLHMLMDRTGEWVNATLARQTRGADGRGVMVGVADTGLDVVHDEMRDEDGKSRVAWLLDLSLVPIGRHKELEERFGVKDESGKLVAGAVFSKADIDELLEDIRSGACREQDATGKASGTKCAPSDEIGHGTHVVGIAASSGANKSKFAGVAPGADIVFVRVTRGRS